MSTSLLFFFVVLITSPNASFVSEPPSFGGRIKHVIAVMFENRAFDHMLGFMAQNRSEIDGCLPSKGEICSNPLNPQNPNDTRIYVGSNAVYVNPADPNHGLQGTTYQLFGEDTTNDPPIWNTKMNGFVSSFSDRYSNGSEIMECFKPADIPILATLANEFGLSDRWFSDVPGPTFPNRMFAFGGTSMGETDMTNARYAEGWIHYTIFEMLDKYYNGSVNQSWISFFQDVPTTVCYEYMRRFPNKYKQFNRHFYEKLAVGDLPVFSWIDPTYFPRPSIGILANDQHPNHDVRRGEQLLKDIYEAVRASPIWNETLLFVYYDEHGGFFDHVAPPAAPNPDGRNASDGFLFNRLGVRVPAVFVSPWIEKGIVAAKPNPNGQQYCHSSLIRTMREQFAPKSPPVSKRAEWSLTFEDVINLDKVRTDCPLKLPNIPLSNANKIHYDLLMSGKDERNEEFMWWDAASMPNSQFQLNLANMIAVLCDGQADIDKYTQTQETLGIWVADCFQRWLQRTTIK